VGTRQCDIDKLIRRLQSKGAREKLPAAVQAIGWKVRVRLCKRYRQLTARGKHVNHLVVNIAREMAAFAWRSPARYRSPTDAAGGETTRVQGRIAL